MTAWVGCGRARGAVMASKGCGWRAKEALPPSFAVCTVPTRAEDVLFWVMRTPVDAPASFLCRCVNWNWI